MHLNLELELSLAGWIIATCRLSYAMMRPQIAQRGLLDVQLADLLRAQIASGDSRHVVR